MGFKVYETESYSLLLKEPGLRGQENDGPWREGTGLAVFHGTAFAMLRFWSGFPKSGMSSPLFMRI